MAKPMKLDDFLDAQGKQDATGGFQATLEPVPDQPTLVKVTPFHGESGCGCSSSFELPRTAVKAITPTGDYHFCCGKRLEVTVVEFAEDAAVPVTSLMARREHDHHHDHHEGSAGMPFAMGPVSMARRAPGARWGGRAGLVGSWPLPGGGTLTCIEVCTRFCHDWGWDCCEWETRCAVS